MATKKLSPTLKAVQQKFFEEQGISSQKVVPSKKNKADAVWPEYIVRTSDGNELDHVKDGLYRYTVSETKLGMFVQLYIDDINQLIKSGLIIVK